VSTKKIPYVNLSLQWKHEKSNLLKIIDKALSTGNWAGGESVKIFEKKIAKLCKTKYAVAVNSGTDALTIGLHLLGVKRGDEVITVPNSFIASTAVIVHLGARPVFVDVLKDQNINPDLIEKVITKKTKAILPVHLTGRPAEMDKIIKLSKKYNIPIIEDAAQSVGSLYKNKPTGSFGKIGCFSAHPLKNLNAVGDSGYLTTNNEKIYIKTKDLINHGMTNNRNMIKNFGYVSRMDNLQAAVLNYRLDKLREIIKLRRKNAEFYIQNLDNSKITVIKEKLYQFNTYHTFVIQVKNRKKLVSYLSRKGINTAVHYPIPIHLQPAAKFLGYKKGSFPVVEKQAKEILTLPIHQNLKRKDLIRIVQTVNNFFN
jgi:dTDP-4-amino-4,6-dideoxygalactose transaminase